MQPIKTNTKILLNSKLSKFSLSLVCIVIITFFLSNITNCSSSIAKVVAITEIVEHPSLLQAKKGIIDEIEHSGLKKGIDYRILHKTAQGSIATAVTIANHLVSVKPDVIVPISTSSAQTVLKAATGTDIPLVFSSVTDPVSAGLIEDINIAKKNITGAIDFPLVEKQIKLIEKFVPHIKTIGFIYSSGEANSLKTISAMKEEIKGKIHYIDSQISSSYQISQAVSALVGKVDAIYIPSDNVIFSALPKLVQLTRIHKIPLFSSDPDSVKSGIFACIGYTQYDVGRAAGKLVVRALNGERNMKIVRPERAKIFVNQQTAKKLNLEIPSEVLGMKTNIIGAK